ncbi:type II toxin-antitoxin system PemK/MazF family toxin [Candidatus Woesearchaeota archaeon]|nr:type II toxin-antitoxin system PemK/MazF family toxin [Candidatus Woesearchaeota archaeon]
MFEQGDVVLVPFPFTDLSTMKQRPALVISKNGYNIKTDDIITCGITSNLENSENSVLIEDADVAEGKLPLKSRIKVGKIFTLKQSLVIKKLTRIRLTAIEKVKAEMIKLIW